MKALLIIVVLGLCAGAVTAQDQEQMRLLQLAQSLEQANEWEKATNVYEDLFRRDPSNYVYFDALRRAYGQLKEHTKAIALVESRLRERPAEVFLMAQLGGLSYDAGMPHRADSLWSAAIAAQPRQRQMYVIVAQQQQERRLYDRAIATYRAGRQAMNLPAEFVDELALLLSATQNYAGAVEEFLRLLTASPQQLPYIESRVASFTMREQGLRQARDVVVGAVQAAPGNITFRSFLAWLEMERGDFASALIQELEIDRRSGAGGTELMTFAQRAFRAGAIVEAREAFTDITATASSVSLRASAKLGIAQCAETMSTRDTSVSGNVTPTKARGETYPTIDQAVGLYEEVRREYPQMDAALQAQFRIGVVRLERLFDLDGALAAFESLRRDPRSGMLNAEAALRAADVQIARNDLTAARSILLAPITVSGPDVADRRDFRLAQIDAFTGAIDSALERLKPLTTTVDRDLANDALMLQVFLNENKPTIGILREYLRADLLTRQRRTAEALRQFEDIVRRAPQAPLADDALMRIADLQLVLGRPGDAIITLRSIDSVVTGSPLADRALFRIAEITEHTFVDRIAAATAYETLLQKYPYSLYTEEARKRLRAIRGGSL